MFTRALCLVGAIFSASYAYANLSIGYMTSQGIHYGNSTSLMVDEQNLWISKAKISSQYQFKNLSNRTIQENLMVPVGSAASIAPNRLAYRSDLSKLFKVQHNGVAIDAKPQVRAYIEQYMRLEAEGEWQHQRVDVTALFKRCGVTEAELMNPWTQRFNRQMISQKVLSCQDAEREQVIGAHLLTKSGELIWSAQLFYSWIHTFLPKTSSKIYYEYQPLLQGANSLDVASASDMYCFNDELKQVTEARPYLPYTQLHYSMGKGQWAKPITRFGLTIERDRHEVMAMCWSGKIKQRDEQLHIQVKDFQPEQDLHIMFLDPRRRSR